MLECGFEVRSYAVCNLFKLNIEVICFFLGGVCLKNEKYRIISQPCCKGNTITVSLFLRVLVV